MKWEYERDADDYYCYTRTTFGWQWNTINVFPKLEIYYYFRGQTNISICFGFLFFSADYLYKMINKNKTTIP